LRSLIFIRGKLEKLALHILITDLSVLRYSWIFEGERRLVIFQF